MANFNPEAILISVFLHGQAVKTDHFSRILPWSKAISDDKHISYQNGINSLHLIVEKHIGFDYLVEFAEIMRLSLVIAPNINVETLKVTLE